ncbi:MAG: nuclear transport factor 2 family protein [Solirubrobacterales bacterium]|nr:nuclear transport factor 2 family protein [Solirubrobacterales bacterium]
MSTHPFRTAVESGDMEAAIAMLADDVVFRSPVVFKPYEGRDAVAPILRAVAQTFEDFRYVKELGDAGDHALVFHARVGDKELDGVDFLVTDDAGRITDFMVMVRPLSASIAVAEAMGRRLAEAGAL